VAVAAVTLTRRREIIVAAQVATEYGFVDLDVAFVRLNAAASGITTAEGNAAEKSERRGTVTGYLISSLVRSVDTPGNTDFGNQAAGRNGVSECVLEAHIGVAPARAVVGTGGVIVHEDHALP